MSRAADALEDLLASTPEPTVRLGAAKAVAELPLHQWDADVILRKLHAIEQAQRSRLW
jgi:hypothetical protein